MADIAIQFPVRHVVVAHLPKASQTYVGSPSITKLRSGRLLACHDIFGPASDRNTTEVFASDDGGASWVHRAEVVGQFWSTVFEHRDAVFLLGPSAEFGSVTIRRSDDEGHSWTVPTNSQNGVLLEGSFHTAPTPVVEYGHRLWHAMEDIGGAGGWPTHFRSFIWSVPWDANLLDARSWHRSNVVPSNPAWLAGALHGWLEGNAVVLPAGGIGVMLRVDAKPLRDRAALLKVNSDDFTLNFDPGTGLITMPGGSVKFTMRRDPSAGEYWAITNVLFDNKAATNPGIVRNTLGLIHSPDLREWTIARLLWHHEDERHYASQYVDWIFDGDDLLAVARTANDDETGGAHDFHDANFLTFFRVSDFRRLRPLL